MDHGVAGALAYMGAMYAGQAPQDLVMSPAKLPLVLRIRATLSRSRRFSLSMAWSRSSSNCREIGVVEDEAIPMLGSSCPSAQPALQTDYKVQPGWPVQVWNSNHCWIHPPWRRDSQERSQGC